MNDNSAIQGDSWVPTDQIRGYTRWKRDDRGFLHADILISRCRLMADPAEGKVIFEDYVMTPDEARLYGVRLIDAAVLADGHRAIRRDDQ